MCIRDSPVATPTNNTLNALKGRNAIIIAPSPAGEKVCSRLLQYFHEELRRIGAPVDLIQQLPSPVDKIRTLELMKLADWLIVTGSQSNVRAAYSSGTPAIGVGAGNVTVIVDETADLDAAAIKIMKSKTFDHATSCSSENALVLVDQIYDTFLDKLVDCGGRLLGEQEKQTLQDSLWVNGKLNRQMLARDAEILCQMADLKIIESAGNNGEAIHIDIENWRIVHIATSRGTSFEARFPRARGRATPKMRESANVEVVLEELK